MSSFEDRAAHAAAFREAWAYVRSRKAIDLVNLADSEEAWALAEAEFVRVYPRFLRLARLSAAWSTGDGLPEDA